MTGPGHHCRPGARRGTAITVATALHFVHLRTRCCFVCAWRCCLFFVYSILLFLLRLYHCTHGPCVFKFFADLINCLFTPLFPLFFLFSFSFPTTLCSRQSNRYPFSPCPTTPLVSCTFLKDGLRSQLYINKAQQYFLGATQGSGKTCTEASGSWRCQAVRHSSGAVLIFFFFFSFFLFSFFFPPHPP